MQRIILACLLLLFLATSSRPQTMANDAPPLLYTHFMPWNQAPPVESTWGWHWTMNHFNPENMDENGKREIASHYYPLTGPYDSMDPDIMEYQVLLMKLSGIDGIIVDWYGTGELWDYPAINDRTNAMFEYIEKAALGFSICYEDQTLKNLINQNIIFEDERIDQGKADISYLENTWFTKDAYLKINNRPVLLNFGPQYFKQSSEWEEIFSALDASPLFFTEDNRVAPAAVGAFSWPPMWKSSDGVLTQASLQEYLDQFSAKSAAWDYRISSAFPGFHDIYKQAGVSDGYGFLDHDNGSTFQLTLNQALSDNPHIIQLVTWNDYGEGTIIEPTEEFGYSFLEMVQNFKKQHIDADFQPHAGHLRMPLQIYQARKEHPNDVQLNATLDQVFQLFVDMQLDAAYDLLKTVVTVEQPPEENKPTSFELVQNYPNPFNGGTIIPYFIYAPAHVKISIYNQNGQKVVNLVSEEKLPGSYQIQWDARGESTGLYFIHFRAGNERSVAKCLLYK